MCSFGSVIIFLYLVIVTTARNTRQKDAIGFPEVDENQLLANKQNRIPVFIPSMCPENELFYPGDQKDDWICDCRPGYLYHPSSDACWPAYRRGPCAISEYLTLPKTTVIPACIKNPCLIDTMVPFRGQCVQLGTMAPCGVNTYPAETLWVNASTLNIECIQINLEQRFSTININNYRPEDIHCCPGCKRYIENKCPPTKS